MTDGVFIQKKDDTYLFQRLPHPTNTELQILVNKIKIKRERKIQKLNLAQDSRARTVFILTMITKTHFT
jgi:hypothetical protein